jgi:hypothetical protein
MDEKELLQKVLVQYLKDNEPNRLEELDVVFDGVYKTLKAKEAHKTPNEMESSKELAFNGDPFTQTAMTLAILAALRFVKEFLKVGFLSDAMDTVQDTLDKAGIDPGLNAMIRIALEKVIGST